jgi:hypothetical protein
MTIEPWAGLSERAVERLARAGIKDERALAVWLATHEEGDRHIGRVMRAELFVWAAERGLLIDPGAHAARVAAEGWEADMRARLAHIPGSADLI